MQVTTDDAVLAELRTRLLRCQKRPDLFIRTFLGGEPWEKQEEICDAVEDECDNEADQFEDCVQEYCGSHPESSSCLDFIEAAG